VPLLIPPETVILRPSSDLLYVEDPALRRSLAYIREHGKTRITVPDVVAASGVNRRLLENKFKQILHRTILEAIQQTHVQVALRMLRETDVKITEICYDAGFANPQRFNETIRNETGLTPLAYRKQHQRG
jgi:AraC-like DNA-binding protein